MITIQFEMTPTVRYQSYNDSAKQSLAAYANSKHPPVKDTDGTVLGHVTKAEVISGVVVATAEVKRVPAGMELIEPTSVHAKTKARE